MLIDWGSVIPSSSFCPSLLVMFSLPTTWHSSIFILLIDVDESTSFHTLDNFFFFFSYLAPIAEDKTNMIIFVFKWILKKKKYVLLSRSKLYLHRHRRFSRHVQSRISMIVIIVVSIALFYVRIPKQMYP